MIVLAIILWLSMIFLASVLLKKIYKKEIKINKNFSFTIIITTIAIILNFPKFFMGNTTTYFNRIVSITFLILWFIFSSYYGKRQNKKYLKFILVYWGIDILSSMLIVILPVYNIDNMIVAPFALWYGCPTYGLRGILSNNIEQHGLMTMSLGLIFSTLGYCFGLLMSKIKKS